MARADLAQANADITRMLPMAAAKFPLLKHPNGQWYKQVKGKRYYFGAISDKLILQAHRILSAEVGVFVEPASAIGVAGLLERSEAGAIPKGATVVITVTGHGLKDPQWAVRNPDGTDVTPIVVSKDTAEVASALGLSKSPA